jgi:hypothetical protein
VTPLEVGDGVEVDDVEEVVSGDNEVGVALLSAAGQHGGICLPKLAVFRTYVVCAAGAAFALLRLIPIPSPIPNPVPRTTTMMMHRTMRVLFDRR